MITDMMIITKHISIIHIDPKQIHQNDFIHYKPEAQVSLTLQIFPMDS